MNFSESEGNYFSRYVPKWKKQACEIPATQLPNSHYTCDEAGEVKCLPGKSRRIIGPFI